MNNRSKRNTASKKAAHTTASATTTVGNSTSATGSETVKILHRSSHADDSHDKDYYGAIINHQIQVLGPKIVKEINDFETKTKARRFQKVLIELLGNIMDSRIFQKKVKNFLITIGTTIVTAGHHGGKAKGTEKKKPEMNAVKQTNDDSIEYF